LLKPIFSPVLRFRTSVTRSDRYSAFLFQPIFADGPCLQFFTETNPIWLIGYPRQTPRVPVPVSSQTRRQRGSAAGGGAGLRHSAVQPLAQRARTTPTPRAPPGATSPLPEHERRVRTPLLGCWLLPCWRLRDVPHPEPLPRAAEPRAPDEATTTAEAPSHDRQLVATLFWALAICCLAASPSRVAGVIRGLELQI
jgi:hypothetical protein